MTTPTGPDDDRLRASTAGQQTWEPGDPCPVCGAGDGPDRVEHCATPSGRDHKARWAGPIAYRRARGELPPPRRRRPAPQQPPAQERDVPRQCWPHQRDASGRCMACGDYGEYTADDSDLLVPDDDAPPSEADSAGEDRLTAILATFAREHGLGTSEWELERLARLLMPHVRAALAASSGVRGGDDQARERLADEELARLFHETYERLAPDFGYRTREDTSGAWDGGPESNRELMIATVAAVRAAGGFR